MPSADELVSLFQKMYKEHWTYTMGAAEEGNVDCSGAFVYAFGRLGAGSIPHGSNSIYRKSIGWVVTTPVPGYAAFKIKKDGNEPSTYQKDGIGNVYHIGLVDEDGKHVLNAKGSKYGFCRDTTDGWTCYAPLKHIDYGTTIKTEEDDVNMEVLYNATVSTKGGVLNMRTGAGTAYGRITSIPNGETVGVLAEDTDGWTRIRYGKLDGYCKSEFLTKEETVSKAETLDATTTIIRDDGFVMTLPGSWGIMGDD